MRILYIIPSPYIDFRQNTGYGRHIRETVSELSLLGYEVKVLSNAINANVEPGTEQNISRKSSIKTFIKALLPRIVWETIRDYSLLKLNSGFSRLIADTVNTWKPDVIYERTCYLGAAILNKKDVTVPWIMEVNAPFVEERQKISGRSLLTTQASRWEIEKYKRADHVFCVSSILKAFLAGEYDVAPSKLTTLPNGVNLTHFPKPASFHSEFDFGFVGSIMKYHGIEDLLIAFARIKKDFPTSKMLIVGDGESLPELTATSNKLGLGNDVVFTDGVLNHLVHEQIAKMKVCIMPKSNWYGSPVKIFEYGAMSKPTIAPKVDPVEEIIEDGIEGKLVCDSIELEQAMREFIENPEAAMEMGNRLYLKVSTHFTWSQNAATIDKVIRDLRN